MRLTHAVLDPSTRYRFAAGRPMSEDVELSVVLALAWLAIWAVVLALFVLNRMRKRVSLRKRYGRDAVPKGLGLPWRAIAPVALLVGAGTSLLLVLGQFRLDRQQTQGTVVLAIDVSESMEANDVEPTRLVAAKAAATTFLDKLPEGFRVGVVTFAGTADLPASPSRDRQASVDAVAGLTSSRGTVIGDGVSEALDAIERDWQDEGKRPSALVLLSDGADTGSDVPPADAAARASSLGVPVFTVAIVGGDSGRDEDAGRPGSSDTALLQEMASSTGGGFSTAATSGELSEVYDALGTRLSSELAVGSSAVPFLAVAVLFALGALAVFFTSRASNFTSRG
jgi:Ca-activated chloride channel family protein